MAIERAINQPGSRLRLPIWYNPSSLQHSQATTRGLARPGEIGAWIAAEHEGSEAAVISSHE
jgi:hypothetical protein